MNLNSTRTNYFEAQQKYTHTHTQTYPIIWKWNEMNEYEKNSVHNHFN